MSNYSPTLVKILNDIAHEWRAKIYSSIVEVLSNYRNTGTSIESVKVSVVDGTAERAPEIRIEFDQAVNIINLRKMQWTKQPPVDELDSWAGTKTLTGPVPGYKNGAPNLPPWKIQQRRVWAIAMSKKKFDSWKARPWRKKSLGDLLKEMNSQVLRAFENAIQKDFENAVKI